MSGPGVLHPGTEMGVVDILLHGQLPYGRNDVFSWPWAREEIMTLTIRDSMTSCSGFGEHSHSLGTDSWT